MRAPGRFPARSAAPDDPAARDLVTAAQRARTRLDDAMGRLLTARAAQVGPAVLRPRHLAVRQAFVAAADAVRAVLAQPTLLDDRGVWQRELTRLSSAGQLHLMQERDDLGCVLPETVRVGSRAATGPAQPGVQFEAASHVTAELAQPRIGLDLRAVVDGEPPPPPRAGRRPQRSA